MQRAVWVGEISDSSLRAEVGDVTFERGFGYASTGQVLSLHESVDGRRVVAVVRGSGRQHYQTVLEQHGSSGGGRRPVWSGSCSCPVRGDCKHLVAVVLAARRQLEQAQPGWERVLAPLVQEADHERDSPAARLGLEVALIAPTPKDPTRFRLRPVRGTVTGRVQQWTVSGASWEEVIGTGGSWARPNPFRAEQRGVVAELHRLWQASGGAMYGYGQQARVYLDQFGPGVWSVLQRSVTVGIDLVPGAGLDSVAITSGAVVLGLDLTRPDGPSGPIEFHPTLLPTDDPDRTPGRDGFDPGELVPIGRPAHGLAVREGARLTMHPLASAPPEVIQQLLDGRGLRVPPQDAERFLRFYAPMLRRHAPVTSSDGTVRIEEPVLPVLLLDVAAHPGHRIELDLAIGYGRRGEEANGRTRLGLEPGPGDPPRDQRAEADLLAGLHALHQVPGLLDTTARRGVRLRPAVALTGTASVDFVTRVLPELRRLAATDQAGAVPLLLTVTGTLPNYGEADGAPVVHLESRDGGEGDWFDLHVSVTVDEQEVPFEQLFTALARGEERLVLESGTWFTLDRPELEALRRLIEEAREVIDPDRRSLRLNLYQAGLWQELVDLGVVEHQSRRWRETVGGLLELSSTDPATDDVTGVDPPAGLRARLRPYQLRGYRWLAHLWDAGLGGVLADDMGLGKTVQALAMIQRARERTVDAQVDATVDAGGSPARRPPVLVVAPASVISTWAEEAARFCPELTVVPLTSTSTRRRTSVADAVAGADLVVTSYTLLRLESERYQELAWDGLILDEAQFVKNHQSKTYRAARGLGVARTFAITGTPLENSLMDLWAMLSLAAPGLYPDPERFGERFRKPIERGYGADQLDTLRRRIRPFVLRRTKDVVAPDLPERQEQVMRVPLAPAHQRIYSRHLQRERQRVLGMLEDLDRNRVAIFRALTSLRQMSLDPGLVDEQYVGAATSAKIDVLLDHLRELVAEGHRALVFSTFTGYLSLVRAALDKDGIGYSYLDGSTRRRGEVISGFRAGTDPVFLISLKAGGFGLTLTEADYVFLLDPWWNPAAEAQAIDRTHRIGQTRPVMVYRLVSGDTIEEKVMVLQDRKRRLFSQVVDGGEFSSGAIGAEDIRGLLS